jgi:hypothetical protein
MMPSRCLRSASAKIFFPLHLRCALNAISLWRRRNLEPFLSLEQRQLPQILAAREHEVERAVQELGFMA